MLLPLTLLMAYAALMVLACALAVSARRADEAEQVNRSPRATSAGPALVLCLNCLMVVRVPPAGAGCPSCIRAAVPAPVGAPYATAPS